MAGRLGTGKNRPMTQGLARSTKTAGGGKRQLQDKAYWIGQLRSKMNEMQEEILKMEKKSAITRQENESYTIYEKRAEETGKEISDFQESLAENNLVLEKLSINSHIEDVYSEIEQRMIQNERDQDTLDNIFQDRQRRQQDVMVIAQDIDELESFQTEKIKNELSQEDYSKYIKNSQGVKQAREEVEEAQNTCNEVQTLVEELQAEVAADEVKRTASSLYRLVSKIWKNLAKNQETLPKNAQKTPWKTLKNWRGRGIPWKNLKNHQNSNVGFVFCKTILHSRLSDLKSKSHALQAELARSDDPVKEQERLTEQIRAGNAATQALERQIDNLDKRIDAASTTKTEVDGQLVNLKSGTG